MQIHKHICMPEQLMKKKEAMKFKESKRGLWKSSEGGKGREKYHNYILILKIKIKKCASLTTCVQSCEPIVE